MTSNGCCLSHNSIVYHGTSPLIYWCNDGDSPPCFVNDGSNVGINTPTQPTGFGLTAFDGAFNLWFYDSEFSGSDDLGYATPGLAFSFPVCGPFPALNRMSTGTDGHVWYSLSSSGVVPQVGYVSTSTCPSPVPVGTSNSTTITGLVGGPSSKTYLTVSSASQSQLWVTTSSLSPTLVNSSSIIPFAVTAIGYAPYDGNLYVQSAAGAIYALSLSTGLASTIPLCVSAPFLADSHGLFSQLTDGTLAYEAPDQNGDPIVTRIVPGVGCSSFQAGIANDFYYYYLFGISSDGSQITVSNGGNISHISF
jgi:hypothetical protein